MSEMDGLLAAQVFPAKKQVPLDGLYLGQNLQELAKKIGRSVVFADFVTDKNGVVAVADKPAHFQIPPELKSPSDWKLFQELMAQADAIISSGAYFKRLVIPGNAAQDILHQYEPGKEFENLGQWRVINGYKKRSPDLAVVSHRMDFEIPEELLKDNRKITVFTTESRANSEKAKALRDRGIHVIGSGEGGVNGDSLVSSLARGMGYRVIMMASGPGVLEILLRVNRLDILYLTQAQFEIPIGDPVSARRMLPGGKQLNELNDFSLTHKFVQENVVTESGSRITQFYLRYDRNDIWEQAEERKGSPKALD